MTRIFRRAGTFGGLNYFFKRRASYGFKALELRNLIAFEFFHLLNKTIFNATLNIFLLISWIYLKPSIV